MRREPTERAGIREVVLGDTAEKARSVPKTSRACMIESDEGAGEGRQREKECNRRQHYRVMRISPTCHSTARKSSRQSLLRYHVFESRERDRMALTFMAPFLKAF